MDKQIKKKTWTLKRIATYGGIALFTVFVGYQFIFADRRNKLKIEKDKITISTVQRGVFQETIPQTGIVEPSRTIYLDAVEGGTIKRVVAESGQILKKGDVILELSNLNRELTVLQQEAGLNESINRVRETRLGITQNDLQQRQELAQIDNMLQILGPQYNRQKQLFEKKLIARQDFEKTEADFKYYTERRKITYEVYKNDSVDRLRQLTQMNFSEKKMTQSLDGMGKILDNLVIRSPMEGQLSRPQLDAGQAVNTGQRLGQVDIIGSYKVKVPIDELYFPRIVQGLRATTTYNNKDYALEIAYIYPTIISGRFDVDMNFVGETPQGIRRGQSLRLRIQLSQSSEELLLPVGGFYKDTGGNWVFVLEDGGNRAVKRDVKLGRKTFSRFFNNAMIKLKNLEKVYTTEEVETTALNNINLEIKDGEFVAIMGPSGCGKSTLLNIVGLLDNPSNGEYYFGEHEVAKYSERQRAQLRKGSIGFVFQSFNLIDELTVFENVELPLLYMKVPASERKTRVEEVLERMNIMHRRNHFPQQLSGGQQQRVAISRAIVAKPKVILADEPTGNLDSANGEEVMKLLSQLNEEGTTIVMVTHSPYDANYAHRIVNLFDGKVVTENIKEHFHI